MTNEALAKAIQEDGNEALMLQLWAQVKRWVAKYAMKWFLFYNGGRTTTSRRGVTINDLIQSGYLAMVDAVQTFEAGNGSFIGWLTFYLQNEFAALYGVRAERTKHDPINYALPFSAPIAPNKPDRGSIEDFYCDRTAKDGIQQIEDNDYIRSMRVALEKALDDIPPKDADTIRRKWLNNQTRSEIAADLGVSYNEIVRREKKGFSYLRRLQTIDKLREFNPYSCTSYKSWYRSGMSVEERYVIMNDGRTHNLTERR